MGNRSKIITSSYFYLLLYIFRRRSAILVYHELLALAVIITKRNKVADGLLNGNYICTHCYGSREGPSEKKANRSNYKQEVMQLEDFCFQLIKV